jgi:hypothetical protein
MKLYVVTFKETDGNYWTEPYLADNHEHAEEQCRDSNPEIEIVNNARIPFYMVERAFYLGKAKRA